MAAPKGHRIPNAPKGRKHGQVNKITALVKDMVSEALHGAGGVAYLQAQANENPQAFLTLVGKLIPTEIDAKAKLDGGLEITWRKPGES